MARSPQSSRYEIHQNISGQFYFILKSANGHELFRSLCSSSKKSILDLIPSFKLLCKDRKHYFRSREGVSQKWHTKIGFDSVNQLGRSISVMNKSTIVRTENSIEKFHDTERLEDKTYEF